MNTSESSNTHKNMTLSEYDFFKGYHRVKGAVPQVWSLQLSLVFRWVRGITKRALPVDLQIQFGKYGVIMVKGI